MFKEVNVRGDIFYYKDAELTEKRWWLNGNLHREDGPAVEYADGSKLWFLNGKRHREDGPAVEHSGGAKGWYLDGKHMGFQAWKREVRQYYDSQEDYLLMLLKLD